MEATPNPEISKTPESGTFANTAGKDSSNAESKIETASKFPRTYTFRYEHKNKKYKMTVDETHMEYYDIHDYDKFVEILKSIEKSELRHSAKEDHANFALDIWADVPDLTLPLRLVLEEDIMCLKITVQVMQLANKLNNITVIRWKDYSYGEGVLETNGESQKKIDYLFDDDEDYQKIMKEKQMTMVQYMVKKYNDETMGRKNLLQLFLNKKLKDGLVYVSSKCTYMQQYLGYGKIPAVVDFYFRKLTDTEKELVNYMKCEVKIYSPDGNISGIYDIGYAGDYTGNRVFLHGVYEISYRMR